MPGTSRFRLLKLPDFRKTECVCMDKRGHVSIRVKTYDRIRQGQGRKGVKQLLDRETKSGKTECN
jgi:hypothetical protein